MPDGWVRDEVCRTALEDLHCPERTRPLMASLYNQLSLADDLWMAAHDTPDGRPVLHTKPVGIGLAAALLGELVVLNWIQEVDGEGRLLLHKDAAQYAPPSDVALSGVLSQLIREHKSSQRESSRHAASSTLSADDWIQHLHLSDGRRLVEQRLLADSHIHLETHRSLFRSARTVYVPSSSSTSGWPSARLKRSLAEGEELDEKDLALAGLIIAIGLESHALEGLSRRHRDFLSKQIQARMRPSLRQLIMRAESAVGRIALTR